MKGASHTVTTSVWLHLSEATKLRQEESEKVAVAGWVQTVSLTTWKSTGISAQQCASSRPSVLYALKQLTNLKKQNHERKTPGKWEKWTHVLKFWTFVIERESSVFLGWWKRSTPRRRRTGERASQGPFQTQDLMPVYWEPLGARVLCTTWEWSFLRVLKAYELRRPENRQDIKACQNTATALIRLSLLFSAYKSLALNLI